MNTPQKIDVFLDKHGLKLATAVAVGAIGSLSVFMSETRPTDADRKQLHDVVQHEMAFETAYAKDTTIQSMTFEDGVVCVRGLQNDHELRRQVICTPPQR